MAATAGKGSSGARRSQVKSRSGCLRCKRMRVKCDETTPTCLRCAKSGIVCDYAFAKLMPARSGAHSRQLMPASSLSSSSSSSSSSSFAPSSSSIDDGQAVPRPPGLLPDLSEREKFYFARFQSHVASAFSRRGHPAGFFSRTASRDGFRDPCIRQCLVAIGALDCALECYAARPGSKVALCHATGLGLDDTQRHLTQATVSYAKALGLLRLRLSQLQMQTAPDRPSELAEMVASPADDWRTSRTALVGSILFVLYEEMQGNTESVQRISTAFYRAFQQKLLRTLDPAHSHLDLPWRTEAGLDDFGVDEGSRFLLRHRALRGLVSCQSGDFIAHSVENQSSQDRIHLERLREPTLLDSLLHVVGLWDKTLTTILTWLHRITQLATQFNYNIPPAQLRVIFAEQARAIAHCQRFVTVARPHIATMTAATITAQARHDRGFPPPGGDAPGAASPLAPPEQQVWSFVYSGALACRLLAQAVLDAAGHTWDRHAGDCAAVLRCLSAGIESLHRNTNEEDDNNNNNNKTTRPHPRNHQTSRSGGRRLDRHDGGFHTKKENRKPRTGAAKPDASDNVDAVVKNEAYYTLYFVVANCRDASVRREGLRLCRRVPYRTSVTTTTTTGDAEEDSGGGCVIWELLANLMMLEALCALEDRAAARERGTMDVGEEEDEGESGEEDEEDDDGSEDEEGGHDEGLSRKTAEMAMTGATTIPLSARYRPVGFWWEDDSMTVLRITSRRVPVHGGIDRNHDVTVRMSLREFERLRGLDPDDPDGKVRFETA